MEGSDGNQCYGCCPYDQTEASCSQSVRQKEPDANQQTGPSNDCCARPERKEDDVEPQIDSNNKIVAAGEELSLTDNTQN